MEPSKKYQPNIEPDLRPDLRIVQGGGESTPERGNLSTAQELDAGEDVAGRDSGSILRSVQGGGESTPERASLSAVNDAKPEGYWAGKDEDSKGERSFSQKITGFITGKKAASGGLIGIIIGGGIITSFFSAPAMLLVQVKEVFTNYGASASRAADSQFENSLFYRLNGGTAAACMKPGAISTVRCKRGTMSEKNYRKLVDSGFDVRSQKVSGRYVISSVAKDGIELDGRSSRAKIKSAMAHPDFGKSMRRASNWSTDVFNGGRFSSIVLKKLGLDKSKVELTGNTDEERRESANKLTGASDEDTDDKRRAKFESAHGSKIKGVAKISSGPTAVAGIVCSGYNMSRATLTAVKLYNAARFASFAILFLKVADQIKANGEVDPGTVALLGGVLTSYATTGRTKGLTATDSQGYKVAAYGGEGKLESFSRRFLLGGNEKLIGLDQSIDFFEDKTPGGKDSLKAGCGAATNLVVGTAVTAAVCAGSGGTSGFIAGTVVPVIGNAIGGAAGVAAGIAACAAIGVAAGAAAGFIVGKIFNYMLPKVIDYLTDAPIDVSKTKGVEAGDALAAGAGVLMENTNISRGLQPGTKESVVAFQNSTADDKATSDSIARYDAKDSPFDVYNEHSFMGSILRKSGIITLNSQSPITTVSTLFSAVLSPLKISSTASALGSSVSITKNDLSNCPDENLKDIGVDCDVVGGIQYSMATNIPEEENLNFMVGVHVDENGTPTSDEYTKWVANCTDNRTDPIGSTSVGIEDEDAWSTGEACVANSSEKISQTTRDQFSTYYYRNAAVEDEDYVPPVEIGDTEGGSLLNIASFNVRGASHDGERGTINYVTRMKRTVDTIKTEGFDIIGFQEFETKQRKEFNKSSIGSTYTLSSNEAKEDNGNAIAWNSSKYELVDQGTQPNLLYTVGNKLKAPWVKLREKSESRREFYFLNTHDPANVHDNPVTKNAARRTDNAREHVAFMKEKASEGVPVFATGDYNSSFDIRKQDANVNMDNIKNTLPYCIMTSDGSIMNAFDTYKKRDVKCPNNDIKWEKEDPGKGCSTQIDHLYYTSEILPVDIVEFGCIKKGDEAGTVAGGNGSDHDTVKFKASINGGDEGISDGDTSWPVDKGFWETDKSDFLDSHGGAGTFTSPGTNGMAVDIGKPPDGSSVYAMVGGKVVKKPLGRSTYSCTGTPNPSNNGGLMVESKVQDGTLLVAYAHGEAVTGKDTVETGEQIMKLGNVGNSCGGHLHLDMSFNSRNICPQDVFLALAAGSSIDWKQMADKARLPCGRS